MRRSLQRSTRSLGMLGLSALALSLAAYGAQADVLPVQNLTFTDFGPGGLPPKTSFFLSNSVGWTGPGPNDLVMVDAPGTATETGTGPNSYPVYGPFADPPPGGNFIQMDGNPTFENSFNQVINGLMAGTTYTLSFWQAAGQQTGFTGATTEQWKVFLAAAGGSFSVNCNGGSCSTSTTGPILEDDSTLMNTPSQGVSAWNLVNMSFLATASTETLSFLAWGDNGNETNLPPTVFLAGVNSPSLIPEPSTWAMMVLGFLGMAFVGRRKLLAKRAAATA